MQDIKNRYFEQSIITDTNKSTNRTSIDDWDTQPTLWIQRWGTPNDPTWCRRARNRLITTGNIQYDRRQLVSMLVSMHSIIVCAHDTGVREHFDIN
jgi:hypothetical protein